MKWTLALLTSLALGCEPSDKQVRRSVRAHTFLALLALGCEPSNDQALRTLRAHGFADIELTGYSYWSCSDSDSFNTGFRATNAKGIPVSGVVCCGWLKACTVRF